jgi:RNA polymerase sigma factor (sigma-70 family)
MSGARSAEILRQLEGSARGPAGGDRELLDRFARLRDQAAFAALVRRHGPVVLAVCRRVAGHPQDAEDAFQAVFLVLAKKAAAVANPDLLGNWLYGVAVRVARRARRSAARRRAREVQVNAMPDPPDPGSAGLTSLGSPDDLGPVLHEELARLPGWYREAIVLCDLRGVPRAEAAGQLGIPEGTLSSRLANGRKKLADRLARRGVALSAAAVPVALGEARAAPPVPDPLVSKTCGLVADWAAGGAVPGAVAGLAKGGFPVRTTVLVGVMVTALAAGGVVLAGRQDDPPQPTDPPKPVVNAVAEAATVPPQKPDEKAPGFTSRPQLRRAADLPVSQVHDVAWSPDGKRLAVSGSRDAAKRSPPHVALVIGLPDAATVWPEIDLGKRGRLVGFTPDGKRLITDVREYNLVSGFHQLRYWEEEVAGGEGVPGPAGPGPGPGPGGSVRGVAQIRTVDLDADQTHGYAFSADGKTFRTVYRQPTREGRPGVLEVREVSAETGRTRKTGFGLYEPDYVAYALSDDGKRLAKLSTDNQIALYDVDRGAKLWDRAPKFDAIPRGTPEQNATVAFSPNGKRLAVTRGLGRPVVLNADTGDPLPPLEGAEHVFTVALRSGFSSDGRLLALTGTRYVAREAGGLFGPGAPKGDRGSGKGPPRPTSYEPAGNFFTLWDTETGKVVKTWDRSATVAFSPIRPLLAVFESNGDQTRLGLWDFAAEAAEKK